MFSIDLSVAFQEVVVQKLSADFCVPSVAGELFSSVADGFFGYDDVIVFPYLLHSFLHYCHMF